MYDYYYFVYLITSSGECITPNILYILNANIWNLIRTSLTKLVQTAKVLAKSQAAHFKVNPRMMTDVDKWFSLHNFPALLHLILLLFLEEYIKL